jgi:hypothetical protein
MPNPMLWRQLPRGLVLWHTHILAIQNVELPKGLGAGDRRTLPVSVSQFQKKTKPKCDVRRPHEVRSAEEEHTFNSICSLCETWFMYVALQKK